MSQSKRRTERIPLHRVLREVYRHYYEFKALVAATGESVIEHTYAVYDDDDNIIERVPVTLSFYDLEEGITDPSILSERKRQAVLLNVIADKKQRDVADIMDITTVSVGQYVEAAMEQLATRYFSKEELKAKASGKRAAGWPPQ